MSSEEERWGRHVAAKAALIGEPIAEPLNTLADRPTERPGAPCPGCHPDQPDLRCVYPDGHFVHWNGDREIWLSPTVADDMALASSRSEGVAEGRKIASDAILAHADKHAPKDGNEAQRRLRRHLHIAARVALPAPTVGEVAAALAASLTPTTEEDRTDG